MVVLVVAMPEVGGSLRRHGVRRTCCSMVHPLAPGVCWHDSGEHAWYRTLDPSQ